MTGACTHGTLAEHGPQDQTEGQETAHSSGHEISSATRNWIHQDSCFASTIVVEARRLNRAIFNYENSDSTPTSTERANKSRSLKQFAGLRNFV